MCSIVAPDCFARLRFTEGNNNFLHVSLTAHQSGFRILSEMSSRASKRALDSANVVCVSPDSPGKRLTPLSGDPEMEKSESNLFFRLEEMKEMEKMVLSIHMVWAGLSWRHYLLALHPGNNKCLFVTKNGGKSRGK